LNLPSEARACDLLIDVSDTRTLNVQFGNARGSHFQRGSRLGIAVTAQADESLSLGTVAIEQSGDGGLSIIEAACYDREGNTLAEAPVELELP
jgi:hypothetical protein